MSDETQPTPDAAAPTSREYANAQVTVEWHPERCTHSANCVRSLPRVFNPKRRPWIEVDAADAAAVAETVRRCPSGALQLGRYEPSAEVPPPA